MQNRHERKAILLFWIVMIPAMLACNLLNLFETDNPSNISTPTPFVLQLDEVQTLAAEYQTWTRLNDEPFNVSAALWALCRLPSPEEEAYLASPHAEYYINVYVNDVGRELITQEGPRTLPVGTIVVKEKLATLEGEVRNELGIMIKDGPSSWQYLYWDNGTLYQSPDEVGHCAECHSTETEGDSVFWPLSPQ
ncbi:MAG: cytochrome P460 family protein [Chloroflexi bacterium]|nr:cytochrome P460 family protein [Chloroflexota bacterium]